MLRKKIPYLRIKKIIDLSISATILILLSPVLVVISFLIRVNMGPGIIFSQERPGINGKRFRIYKFRTMRDRDPSLTQTDEERITRLGRFLRASSLDELPELINVLKGEMSLVGPRPLLVEYLDRYSKEEFRRHDVLPGISGLAQVKGRNELSWRHKFRYDLFYVKKISFKLDTMIIIKTFIVVLARSGFRSHGEPKKFGE